MAYSEPDVPVTGTSISSANFGIKVANNQIDHQARILTLEGNVISARQGGSATAWETAGTANYTPTASKIQTGVFTLTYSDDMTQSGTITFPVAYEYAPIVIVGSRIANTGSIGNNAPRPYVYSVSNTQFVFTYGFEVNITATIDFPWIAIGE